VYICTKNTIGAINKNTEITKEKVFLQLIRKIDSRTRTANVVKTSSGLEAIAIVVVNIVKTILETG